MNGERILEEYARDCTERMMRTDFSALNQIIELFFQAKEKGNVIYTAGNGGSLATSSHICNDLLKGCSVDGKPGFHAECLGDSSAILTCLSIISNSVSTNCASILIKY